MRSLRFFAFLLGLFLIFAITCSCKEEEGKVGNGDSPSENSPPVVNLGMVRMVIARSRVDLTADVSDPEGDPLFYTWTIVSRPANSSAPVEGENNASCRIKPDQVGEYEIKLIVNDGTNVVKDSLILISRGLADSGQKTSYTGTFGEDSDYQGPMISFADNGDGTVTDNSTGLMWQKSHHTGTYTFNQAPNYCSGLNLGGYGDWRVPSTDEILKIVNYGAYNPAIYEKSFSGTPSGFIRYWTSNSDPPHIFCGTRGYILTIQTGVISLACKNEAHHARCVRGKGIKSGKRFKLIGNGTTIDGETGLI